MAGEIYEEKYETEQLTARVRKGLHAQMKAAKPRGMGIGWVWTRAAEVFLKFPRPVQLAILQDEDNDETLMDLLAQMADEQASAMRAAAVADEQSAYEASRKERRGRRARKTG